MNKKNVLSWAWVTNAVIDFARINCPVIDSYIKVMVCILPPGKWRRRKFVYGIQLGAPCYILLVGCLMEENLQEI